MSEHHARGAGWDLFLAHWEDALGHVPEGDLLLVDAPYWERVGYADFNEEDVRQFVAAWAPRTRGWFVALTDLELYPVWRDALGTHGRYVFAPVPCPQVGPWTRQAVVARPRSLRKHRTLCRGDWGNSFDQGLNTTPVGRRTGPASEPTWLLRALVRDYSRPGDLVCAPRAGSATTLVAAVTENRRAIGFEPSFVHYKTGILRMQSKHTASLFGGEP